MNTMLEMHILKQCRESIVPTEMKMQFFTRGENIFDHTEMGVHDPYGHKQTNTKIKRDILSVLITWVVYRKQQTRYKICPKDELMAPSLPLESDVDAVFKLCPLLLAGLIPPPQWWIRGIRNTSICMDNYLLRGCQVSGWPAFSKYS